jgi:formylglycine-generating enzyme
MSRQIAIIILSLFSFGLFSSNPTGSSEHYLELIPGTDLKFKMVPIPSGEFYMGTSPNEKVHQLDESPVRKIRLDAFWMASHEITWDLYELFLDKEYEKSLSKILLSAQIDGLSRPSTPYLDMTFGMGKDRKPAVGMTQYNAIQFCKWLYLKTGNFYRLPTEAEWEYAARAGSTSNFHYGNQEDQMKDYAIYAENSNGTTQNIGSKKPNKWGLYDMLGNVLEWTYDHYAPYSTSQKALHNPVVVSPSLYPKVLRGGHFLSPIVDLRSGKRFFSDPKWKQLDPQIPKSKWWFPEAPFVGLRVVRPFKNPSEKEINDYYHPTVILDY